jgi:cell division septum initiation protein DivIVA
MSRKQIFVSSSKRPDPVPRLLSAAALVVSIVALVSSLGGLAPAAKTTQGNKQTVAAKRAAEKKRKAAKNRSAALTKRFAKVTANCPISGAIDLGSWCLESSTFKVPPAEAGQNDYVYAAQKCVKEGGWLPTAAQLIGAAPVAALKSTADDDPGTSGTSEFPEAKNGIKDEREMTSDLFTTTAGARAAGSEGVSEAAKGTGNLGEPDPVPIPAEPLPETLDYVTVFDNHNIGGFAGGEPVGKAENFRCAYAKGYQGKPKNISGRS